MLALVRRKGKLKGPGVILFGLLFCGVASLLFAHGVGEAQRQARLLSDARPYPATVISTEVVMVHGKKRTRYRPEIVYQYDIDGMTFKNAMVFPLDSGSRQWSEAQEIVDRYPVGSATTVFCLPYSPRESFLIRRIEFDPYWLILFPMLHFSVGLAILLFHVRPSRTPLGDVRRWGIVLSVLTVVAVLANVHYAVVGGAVDGVFIASISVCTVIIVPLAWWWSRSYIMAVAPARSQRAGADRETKSKS